MPINSPLRPQTGFLVAVHRNLRLSLFALLLLTTPVTVGAAAEPLVPQEAGATHEASEAEHDAGWGPTIAKTINFAVLAGILVYFLRTPFAGYLTGRSETIRKDLVDAASLRTSSERQLAEVRERLARLPAEIDGLQRRGQEELAQERVRLADATARERDRVLERTRREIDAQFRAARRELLEHVADLSMKLARTRIEREITPEDQSRLIERYASEVRP